LRKRIDLSMIGIYGESSKSLSIEHKKILELLIRFIYKNITSEINYDHLNLEIARANIPLKYDGHRADISFVYGDRLVFIDIETRKSHIIHVKEGKVVD